MKPTEKDKKSEFSSNNVMKYLSLSSEFIGGIGISLYVGKKIDDKYPHSIPLFVWILPLIVIFALIFKLIKDVLSKK